MEKRYKNYGFRIKLETLELLKKLKSINGKSWNLFFYEMAKEHANSNKNMYRNEGFAGDYKKYKKNICEECGVALVYKRIGRYNRPNLCVHHIDGDITNNNPDNLKTLCNSCHGKN